jgi:hypothetical protein
MGKLVGHYVPGEPVVHRVQGKPKLVPTKRLVLIDASDAKYVVIDGRRRRRPETLPPHRRWPDWRAAA